MADYEFVDHTADVKFIAQGDSLEKAFLNSAKALKEAICGNITVLEQITKKIEIKAESLETLLQKFLEEFLFHLDSEDFLLSEIKEFNLDSENFKLTTEITGDKASNYKFTNDVKAITYNEMSIKQENKTWKISVVLDV